MDAQPHEEQIGGTPGRVADPYIWATIHYLDSPTYYRECLRYNRHRAATPGSKLVMLDERHPSLWTGGLVVMIIGSVTCALLSLLMHACDW